MNEFYDSLSRQKRASVQDVAVTYGRTVYHTYERLLRAKTTSASPYYVGLSSDVGCFTNVTKRLVLVADTMLLSDHGIKAVHELGERRETSGTHGNPDTGEPFRHTVTTWRYGMVTKDLAELGQWQRWTIGGCRGGPGPARQGCPGWSAPFVQGPVR
ncbi:hypothetical protein GCM10010129_76540 [Streptomyces fumigatiscleroticus]|nr:hypothetical protein GCM10010129_76540 [Streptomyces fumigatiscleroticus]